MSAEEDNKALVRRWFDEVIGNGSIETLNAICADCHPQFVVIKGVMDPAPMGMAGLRDLIMTFRTAFPDLQAKVEDQVAEGEKVVTRVTMSGTHKGDIFGLPPTGKSFSVSGISIWEVEAGRLVQEWVNWDMVGMLQQLGVMPAPGQVPATA